MPAKRSFVPKYCLHKPSGFAYVRISGKVIYLGEYDSPGSKEEYGRLITEFATNPTATTKVAASITVVELADAYWQYAEGYYVKQGKPTSGLNNVRLALRLLRKLYAASPADKFGPLAIKAIRQSMLDSGRMNRTTINKRINTIKQVFRWAVAEEMILPSVYHGLQAVPGLRRGRSKAREAKPILPVADSLINATLPHMPPIVADMVRIHRLVGCRPGELCQLRPINVDTSVDVWVYRPESHKTEHHGHDRMIYIGPKAQAILTPYLQRDPKSHCFSPAESVARLREAQRARRKTPIQPSQHDRRKTKPKRSPRTSYSKDSYNRAIGRAIKMANKARSKEAEDMGIEPILLPHWHANQLRHAAATEIRREYGLEAAQLILGHAKADVTQVYAERDARLAMEVSKKIG